MSRVKRICFLIICAVSSFLIAQTPKDVWTVQADIAPGARYFGDTAGNGILGLVSAPDPFSCGAVWMQGVYDRAQGFSHGGPANVDVIHRAFNVVNMALAIDGTGVNRAQQVTHLRQALNLKHGTMTTSFDYQDKASVSYTWYALRQLPYTALVEVTITAKQPIDITATVNPEAPPKARDVQYTSRRFQDIRTPPVPLAMVTATAHNSSGEHLLAASHAFLFDTVAENSSVRDIVTAEGAQAITFTKHLDARVTYHFVAVGSTITSVQNANPRNEAERLTLLATLVGGEGLIAQHNRAWDDLWRSDVVIEGDDETQRNVHAMIYHLYAFTRAGGATALSPMGLSGRGYNGHVFWDSETWMFPVLLALHPEMAESLMEYRFERLGAARQNAVANGYRGAMFPWESAASGDEDTPLCCLTGLMEQHITADIGIAAWQYYEVTQDKAWLKNRGWPILQATADFWASRVTRNGPKQFNICSIVGADESQKNICDDAWTNATARENLANAIAAGKVLGTDSNPDWAIVRDNIPILRFPNGLIKHNAAQTDSNTVNRHVLMLAYPLHDLTDPEEIKRYIALSPDPKGSVQPGEVSSIFITLFARLGMTDQAYTLFRNGYSATERPPFGVLAESAKNDNVYFATAAGGFLQSLIYGFGGLNITPSGINQMPTRLPRPWKSLILTNIGVNHKTYTVH